MLSTTLSHRVLALLASILLATACGPSYEERQQARDMQRQKLIPPAQEALKKFGVPYGAKPWELSRLGDRSKFTAHLQEEIEGSTVAIRAQVVDVVRHSDDDYELIVGNHFLGQDILFLRSIRGGVADILANPPGRFDEFLLVAEIQKVQPLPLELNPCDEPDCGSISLEPSITGIAHRITGRLVAIERGRSDDAQ